MICIEIPIRISVCLDMFLYKNEYFLLYLKKRIWYKVIICSITNLVLKIWKINNHFENYYWCLVLVYLTIVCTHEKNKILGSGMLLSVTTEIFIHTKIDIILWFTYHIS